MEKTKDNTKTFAAGKKFDRFGGVKTLPFWSWNDLLEKDELLRQIEGMKKDGIGGFFMHARSGLKTEYLSDEWFEYIRVCAKKAKEEGMEAWVYDENGWPSGTVGGKMLRDKDNLEWYLEADVSTYDSSALVSYDISGEKLRRIETVGQSGQCLNIYRRVAVSSVDLLDGRVVDKFLDMTHEEYKRRLGDDFKLLKGFFTDEPQFCRTGAVYPHLIGEYFFNEYGQDVLDGLGLLFVEKEGYRSFRYRYRKGCQELFLKNFAQKVYGWCNENGVMLTGHYIEERDLYAQMLFNSGIMPFYEYEHIPGIDWLCKRFMSVVPARQVGSVAAQLQKEQVLTEAFAMTGWDATPKELKAIAEFQHFYGTNTVCQHLLPYSESESRKYDHPLHFSKVNPWISEGFKPFNEYLEAIGGFFKNTEEFVNVAVLHPVRSAYFEFRFGDENSTKELDDAFLGLSDYLAKHGIGFHYLDETLLAKHGFVRGAKIGCGVKEYKYLIIPKCYTMDKTTERMVREFAQNGGKLLFVSDKPQYLEGEEHDYSYLNGNVTLEEIAADQPYSVKTVSEKVFSSYRKCGEFDCICLLNTDDDRDAECNVTADGVLSFYDVVTGKQTACNGKVILRPLQSAYLIVEKSGEVLPEEPIKKRVVLPCESLRIAQSSDNALLLDFAEYSTDGESFSPRMLTAGIFRTLLKARYNGKLVLRFPFEVREIPERAKLLSEYAEGVSVNGERIAFDGRYCSERGMLLGDIARLLRRGENTVEVDLQFYQSEQVYYALFGKGVTESVRNCLVYDTYINNLYVLGDFGVFTDLPVQSARERDVVFAEDFYIAKRRDYINGSCCGGTVLAGYPFFAGSMKFVQELVLEQTDVLLVIPGNIHLARIRVNGACAGELLFEDCLDISAFAKKGKNIIEIEVFTGARNFYGPHHDARFDENYGVSPFSFELPNGWKNGKNILARNSYSLVNSGIIRIGPKPWYSKSI